MLETVRLLVPAGTLKENFPLRVRQDADLGVLRGDYAGRDHGFTIIARDHHPRDGDLLLLS